MPAALVTTKRKFHRILDSISNASSTSLAAAYDKSNASSTTLPGSRDSPAKKPRISRPTSAYVQPSTRLTAMSTKNTRPISSITQAAQPLMNEDRKAPNFAPWDRGQFLARLKTFRHVDKWRGKPEKINEVEWAKRGWSCVGKERVGCVAGCGTEVVIMLESSGEDKENSNERLSGDEENVDEEDDWREKAQEQLVEKYTDMITSAHDSGCLWQRKGCDDTIHRLSLAHQTSAIDNLRQRYLSLLAMASELPPEPSIPEGLNLTDINEQLIPLLYPPPSKPQQDTPSTGTKDASNPPLNTSALALALFGWQAEEGHIPGLATCTVCFRRLGLWLFKPSSDSTTPSSMDRLDVVGEHRDYCPWVNALSQNGASSRRSSLEGLSGWEILLRAVKASTLHKKYDQEKVALAEPEAEDDVATEVVSVKSLATSKGGRADQDEKDKERWAKLKKLKQAFHVRKGRVKDVLGQKPKSAIG